MDKARKLEINEDWQDGSGDTAPSQSLEHAPPASAEAIEAMVAERDRLAQEKAALYDQLLRSRAEFDNFRKRSEREKAEARDYAAMALLRDLLPVLDAVERALQARAGVDDEFHAGLQLIARQLWDTLARY